jgi:exodeoxyribonuclease V gamma subunit
VTVPWQPGFVALHGNQTDTLADAVAAWLARHPLPVLEPEVVLVQSNGMAEWFKMQLAQQHGVCAAARVELPARFLWRTYRQVLGRQAVPRVSPLDKIPLVWRLMRLLPQRVAEPVFAPLARFLRPGEPQRLLQLAERLADLFDQYQIYRGDWLQAWADGRAVLCSPGRADQPLPAGQAWQAALWQAVLADLPPEALAVTRAAVSSQALARLQSSTPPAHAVAPRVVVFGLSHMPLSMLQLLAALARHSQVLLAVSNPCRFHWADAIDGRELLRLQRRRQPLREGRDLAALPLEAMHAHAHPLLAAWGRQSRDYVRQLDAFDTTEESAARLQWPRVDLFDEAPADQGTLLQQAQRSIRDLLPLAEHPRARLPAQQIAPHDQSIVFHSAHSLVRELEVLHDQLLERLAMAVPPGQPALQPRDIVVMLPDVQAAAPSIRAVFGQYARTDARHIPFDIADLSARISSPLVVALQWLLQLPRQRCRLSELCDLLEVPAVAARFGLEPDAVPRLTQWMAGCGIRWGLNAPQRGSLGLQACGEHNSAWFGLRRMLLGYASGGQPLAAAFDGIEPYDEVGGLDAELAGVLAAVLDRLLHWWQQCQEDASPQAWAGRLRQLLQDLFLARDENDRAVIDALQAALVAWLDACDQASYAEPVPLAVAQSAWLAALEQPSLDQRFRAGGVTFCTLMPMRAIPFEMVCLLGMNDGDYPRRAQRSDFDLMQQPGHYRPGDRARRDDDRQLMLEALLSARRTLYISWAGHHVRDNSEQPPSVLVSQLRDYLAAGWRGAHDLLAERSTQHPLQPFSRAYFEAGTALSTHATEWRDAHAAAQALTGAAPLPPPLPPFVPDPHVPLTLRHLTAFLRQPASAFFHQRLSVYFDQNESSLEDDEVFRLDGLQSYQLVQELQQPMDSDWQIRSAAQADGGPGDPGERLARMLQARLHRLERAGRLPLAGLGQREAAQLQATLLPSLLAWQALQARYPQVAERRHLHYQRGDVVLDDWLDALQLPPAEPDAPPCWLVLDARDLADPDGRPRPDKLLPVYVRCLVAAACGVPMQAELVGRGQHLQVQPMDMVQAQAALDDLLDAWRAGQDSPLPLPRDTSLALAGDKPDKAGEMYDGGFARKGEATDAYWARLYPDYEALDADGRLQQWAPRIHGPLLRWCGGCVRMARSTLED